MLSKMRRVVMGIWLAGLTGIGVAALVLFMLDGRSFRTDTALLLFMLGVFVTTLAEAVAPWVRRRFAGRPVRDA